MSRSRRRADPTSVKVPLRASRIAQLCDPSFLEAIVGEIVKIDEMPMGTPGFSGATHSRHRITPRDGEPIYVVLKRTSPGADWTAHLSGDRVGREAMLLATPELAGVWDVFASPFLAYASEDGAIGLLMHDLSDCFPPDVRAPLEAWQEHAIVDRIASLHAKYWARDLSGCDWLAGTSGLLGLLAPGSVREDSAAFEATDL